MLMIAGVYRLLIIASLSLATTLATTFVSGCDRKVAGGSLDGATIFREVCARCHGANGEPSGSMVARYGVKSLRTERVQTELKDADIRAQILNGSKNKQMPSFSGAISDEQIAAVIAHIRTLRDEAKAPPGNTPAVAEPPVAKPPLPSKGDDAADAED